MKQVGQTAWVDPSAVVAVDWDTYTERMPRIWLGGGTLILADYYSTPSKPTIEQRQEALQKLLEDLELIQKAPKWPGFNPKY